MPRSRAKPPPKRLAHNGAAPRFKLIVIGASAGGVEALRRLADTLPDDIPAAVCIVLHISATGPSFLPQILNRRSRIPAAHAQDGAPLKPGRIYVAPPDRHLLIKPGKLILGRGPRENNARPAVDALFRTAARAYGPWTIGVVLSGGLDDGTVGLHEIKQHGGHAVVQDPHDALFPSMPQSALQNVAVDQVVPIDEMATALAALARRPIPSQKGVAFMARRHHAVEPDIAEAGTDALKSQTFNGPPSPFTCPECGGALWELQDGKLLRYRCHVGHGYTAETLIAAKSERLEDALWSALRSLEENAAMRRRMAGRFRAGKLDVMARNYEEQAHLSEQRAGLLRQAMMATGNGNGNHALTPAALETRAQHAHDRDPGHLVPYATRARETRQGTKASRAKSRRTKSPRRK